MENGLFIGDFPVKTSIHRGFAIAMFDYRRATALNKHLAGPAHVAAHSTIRGQPGPGRHVGFVGQVAL